MHATLYLKKMRAGVVLDFPHSHSLILLVLFKQQLLHAFHTSPAYSGRQAFPNSFRVGRFLSTNLTTSELAGRTLPLLKLRQISRQFQFEFAFLCAMLGLAFCVVARLTSLAFRIGACRVKTDIAYSSSSLAVSPHPLCVICFSAMLLANVALKCCFLFLGITLNATIFPF